MRHFYKLLTLLIIGTILLMPMTAFADEYKTFDKYTGEEIFDDPSLNNIVYMDFNCDYSRSDRLYIYTTSTMADSQIKSTAFNGMITTDKVAIQAGQYSNIIVYRDGKEISPDEIAKGQLSAVGNYKVFSGSDEVFHFTIIGSVTGLITVYDMPQGFTVKSVRVGEKSAQYSKYRVEFLEEGDYEVKYNCTTNGASYTLKTKIDFTAPEINLVGVVNGEARGPVDIEGIEDGASLIIKFNDEVINTKTHLTSSGDYQVFVTDKAGNTNRYVFTIRFYFNMSAWAAIALIVAAVGGLLGYIFYSRKHLRIR